MSTDISPLTLHQVVLAVKASGRPNFRTREAQKAIQSLGIRSVRGVYPHDTATRIIALILANKAKYGPKSPGAQPDPNGTAPATITQPVPASAPAIPADSSRPPANLDPIKFTRVSLDSPTGTTVIDPSKSPDSSASPAAGAQPYPTRIQVRPGSHTVMCPACGHNFLPDPQ
jgi:hypothetical protein